MKENCDDGNSIAGDGCSDECTIEWAEKWQGEGAAAIRKGGKGPYLLTAVREVQPAVTKLVDTVRLRVYLVR